MASMSIMTLMSIKRLDVPATLDASAVDDLCLKLDEFVQTLPAKTYEWTRIFSAGDFNFLTRQLHELGAFLDSIYAAPLADRCSELIAGLANKPKLQLDVPMQRFLTELMTLSIDIQTAKHKPENRELPMSQTAAANSGKKTILAVDDWPLLLRTLKSMIDEERYVFHGLNSGVGALNYLQKHEPDLFILDIEMPQMDGYELFTKIREMGHVAPIIFLTGNSTREYVLRAIQLGADGFLAKPVQKHLVMEKLKELLG